MLLYCWKEWLHLLSAALSVIDGFIIMRKPKFFYLIRACRACFNDFSCYLPIRGYIVTAEAICLNVKWFFTFINLIFIVQTW